jgi:hypothetical protein
MLTSTKKAFTEGGHWTRGGVETKGEKEGVTKKNELLFDVLGNAHHMI